MSERGRRIGEEFAESEAQMIALNKSLCTHERVHQFSTIYARTDWTRDREGYYQPDEVPCSKVLEEETDSWKCADCDEILDVNDTGEGATLMDDEGEPILIPGSETTLAETIEAAREAQQGHEARRVERQITGGPA